MARKKKTALRKLVEKTAKRVGRVKVRVGRALERRAKARAKKKAKLALAAERARRKKFRPKRGHVWVFAKKVRIPARPMVPEGDFGPIWTQAFEEVGEELLDKFGRDLK